MTITRLLLCMTILFVVSCTQPQSGKMEKGMYFPKKEYTPQALPTFENSRAQLPVPVLDGNPGWVDMYWRCWEIAFTKLRQPKPGSPFVSNYIDEGFNDNVFQWDTNCMLMFGKYAHHIFPFIESHDNFFISQHPDGYICREINEADGSDFIFADIDNTVNSPLFGWIELEYYKFTGDTARLSTVLPAMEKLAEFLETGRKWTHTRHNLYWQTMLGSGMDNLPRSGVGWVDMSSQVKLLHSSLAEISKIIGEPAKEKLHQEKADSIAELINYWMWSEKLGLYCNISFQGDQIEAKNAAAFWPMLAGIPSEKQAGRLVQNAMDTATFYRYLPFASLAATEKEYHSFGNYWQGGVWTPLNYMILKGMEKYGYSTEAHKAAEKYLSAMYEDFKTTNTFWEYYSPDKGYKSYRDDSVTRNPKTEPGRYWAKPDFVGWTGIAPITILIEDVIGIKSNGVEKEITWDLFRNDRHGIQNLDICGNKVSLIYQPASESNNSGRISIETSQPFTLHINRDGKRQSYPVVAGVSEIKI